MHKISVIQTTIDDKVLADQLISELLNDKMIACAQISQIESHYWWQTKIEKTMEYRILFKLPSHNANLVLDYLAANHSYEVPEIIMEEKQTTESYYNYCVEACHQ